MNLKNNDTTNWFWVWLRTITMNSGKYGKASSKGEVWDNLCLIEAHDEEEAYAKARNLGHLMEGGSVKTLRYNGKPAYCRFLGITDMGVLHDGVEDGAEILYRSSRQTLRCAKIKIKTKKSLLTPISKQLALARKVATIPIDKLVPAPPRPKLVRTR